MNRFSLLSIVFVWLSVLSLEAVVDPIAGSTSGYAGYPYRLYTPEGASTENPLPLILFLHGSFERGRDNKKHVKDHIQPLIESCMGSEYPAFLVAPQSYQFWDPTVLRQFTESLIQKLPVDPTRVYITGISVGGRGTWDTLSKGLDLFAAGVPLSARAKYGSTRLLGSSGIPLWAFHGDNDPIVPLRETTNMVNDIKDAGGAPRFTELQGFAHNDWSPIYADAADYTDSWTGGSEEDETSLLYPWLFAQQLPETPHAYPVLHDDEVLLLDFGGNHCRPDNTFWNNISVNPQTPRRVISSLLTQDGQPRNTALSILDGFEGMEETGESGSLYPSQVSADSWWTGSPNGHEDALAKPATIVLNNLPPDKTYRLKLFASREGTDGELDRRTRFTANNQSIDLEASDNQNQVGTLHRMVSDNEGNLEITVSPSPEGNGRFAYLSALELMVEPWPLTFAYWKELNGVQLVDPMADPNKNGVPELMDFLYGNEVDTVHRSASFKIVDGTLNVKFPIRVDIPVDAIVYLEQSSDLVEPWLEMAHYNFLTEEITNLEISFNDTGTWLNASGLTLEPGTFYRLRAEVP